MFGLEDVVARIKAGLWTFSKLIYNSNHDYPYHDSHQVTSQSVDLNYVVGHNQVNTLGNIHKLFTSKNTLIFSTEDTTVRFNDPNNYPNPILANILFTFYSNIWQVFYPIPGTDKKLYFWFEGVLPEEARSPE